MGYRKMSEEHKQKLRESHTGLQTKENNPNWKNGKPNCVDCGKKLKNYKAKRCQKCNNSSKEFTERTSKKLKGRIPWNIGKKYEKIAGEKHWNYQGGITSENHKIRDSLEMKLWIK